LSLPRFDPRSARRLESERSRTDPFGMWSYTALSHQGAALDVDGRTVPKCCDIHGVQTPFSGTNSANGSSYAPERS
jgi:hypothetical protein